jgi:membrane-bound inhibitor of C-type lysozyme
MVQAGAAGGGPRRAGRPLLAGAVGLWPVLAGVLSLAVAPPPGRAEAGLRADYLCKGRFDASAITAFFFNGSPSAVVLLEGEGATRLPQTVSASGARYSDGEQSFWVKGDRATWQQGQAPARSCEPRPR